MYRAKHIPLHKALALLLSFSLILTAVFGGTFAQIIAKTPSFINTFLSGLDPTGDLVIRKEVTHPFGSGYTVPDDLSFDFTVSLGADYAGKTVETSQGDMTADENGNITVSAAPDGAVRIKDLMDGTSVTVTESPKAGFAPEGGAEKSVTIQSGNNTIVYTNAYTPGPVDPVNVTVTGTKLLEGRDWQEGDSFTFQLEYKLAGEGQDWQSAGTTAVSYDPADPDFNKFSFTELVRGIAYASAGEYAFRVSEVDGTIGGITYDNIVSYFDVTVGDADMNGSLEIQGVAGYQNATASYDASANQYHVDVTVNNKYAPVGTATAVIHIDKRVMSMSGEDKSPAGYTFELYDENGNLVATSGETSAAGEIAIELTFEAKDAGTTFHYTLKESHSGEIHNGMTYDDTVYPISVSVVDNLDGTISAYIYNTADYKTELVTTEPEEVEPEETEPEETEPTETDEDPTEGTDDPTEDGETLTEGTDDSTEDSETSEEGTDDPNAGNEDSAESTDTSAEDVDDLDATDSKSDGMVSDPAEVESESEKSMTTPADDVETASIEAPTEDTTDLSESESETEETLVHSSASAPPEFSNAFRRSYPSVDSSRTIAKPAAVLETKKVVVIPEDAGNTYSVSFVNVYDPADTRASFDGSKELAGRDLNKGEFSFNLYATGDSFAVAEGMEPVQRVANDADGDFTFAAISYDEVGTYRYVVKEDASAKLGGITYDDSVFHVIVTVMDENGVLTASTSVTDELGTSTEIVFHNTYKAAAASVTFTGTKTLTGKKLTADMFRFHLYRADENYTVQGAAVSGASNDASGRFAFKSISCSEPGIFYYVVKEDASAQVKGMTYDDTAYGIKVTVLDDGQGQLVADTVICKVGGDEVDMILFENSYTEPEKPTGPTEPSTPTDPDPTDPSKPSDPTKPTEPEETKKPTKPSNSNSPDTGDNSNVEFYLRILFVSVVAIIVLLLVGKRQKKGGRYLR